ncbi:MAG: hypothetical protein Q7R62_03255 [bacterium]|nr:hypothetical protein [bacterium]
MPDISTIEHEELMDSELQNFDSEDRNRDLESGFNNEERSIDDAAHLEDGKEADMEDGEVQRPESLDLVMDKFGGTEIEWNNEGSIASGTYLINGEIQGDPNGIDEKWNDNEAEGEDIVQGEDAAALEQNKEMIDALETQGYYVWDGKLGDTEYGMVAFLDEDRQIVYENFSHQTVEEKKDLAEETLPQSDTENDLIQSTDDPADAVDELAGVPLILDFTEAVTEQQRSENTLRTDNDDIIDVAPSDETVSVVRSEKESSEEGRVSEVILQTPISEASRVETLEPEEVDQTPETLTPPMAESVAITEARLSPIRAEASETTVDADRSEPVVIDAPTTETASSAPVSDEPAQRPLENSVAVAINEVASASSDETIPDTVAVAEEKEIASPATVTELIQTEEAVVADTETVIAPRAEPVSTEAMVISENKPDDAHNAVTDVAAERPQFSVVTEATSFAVAVEENEAQDAPIAAEKGTETSPASAQQVSEVAADTAIESVHTDSKPAIHEQTEVEEVPAPQADIEVRQEANVEPIFVQKSETIDSAPAPKSIESPLEEVIDFIPEKILEPLMVRPEAVDQSAESKIVTNVQNLSNRESRPLSQLEVLRAFGAPLSRRVVGNLKTVLARGDTAERSRSIRIEKDSQSGITLMRAA